MLNMGILDHPHNLQGVLMHYEKTVFVNEFNFQHYAVTNACKFSVKSNDILKFDSHTNIHLHVRTAYFLNLKSFTTGKLQRYERIQALI
jgi:hypothetical protein